MKELKEALEKLAAQLADRDSEILVLADKEENVELLAQVATTLMNASSSINSLVKGLDYYKKEASSEKNVLEDLVVLATEFDKSGDPYLQKQASVLDEILRTIGSSREAVANAKKAYDEEIERIREKAKKDVPDPYTMVKAEHDKQNGVEEAKKAIDAAVKEYKPLEAPLSTRTCPDHPGAQLGRIAENTYQCSLDKGIYNFQSGFTSMKGNKIPGGDVSSQTQALHDRPNEFTSFDTRESKLNPS